MSEAVVEKVAADVIADLAKSAAGKVFSAISGRAKSFSKELEIELGLTFRSYLAYAKETNSQIKTLLYRHTPKYLYDFYECIGVYIQNRVIDTADVNNILDMGHDILITGTGGSGKSVMMRHFFLDTIQRTNLVPVLIELRGLNDQSPIDLKNYLRQTLANQKLVFDKEEYFHYSLEAGCYVFLLDGYDEVRNSVSSYVAKEIQTICEEYPKNYYIVSSRPLHEFVGWKNFLEMRALSLTKQKSLNLIQKLDYEQEVKQKFYRALDETLYHKYKSFASNPLLLTIMFLTFDGHATIPDKLNDFYEQAFITLFNAHDATKGAYQRDTYSKLGYDDFKRVFSYFCFKSFFRNRYSFTEVQALNLIEEAKERGLAKADLDCMGYLRDLSESVCMLIREGLRYQFSHRSFQEYFAAIYTTQFDDAQQSKFLTTWLHEKNYRKTSNYLDMLCDLAPHRFERNLMLPMLRELREEGEACGVHRGVQLVYYAMCLEKRENENNWSSYFAVANGSYADIIQRSCIAMDYSAKTKAQNDKIKESAAYQKCLGWFLERYREDIQRDEVDGVETSRIEKEFSELRQDGTFEKASPLFYWAEDRFDCAMAYLDKLESGGPSRKRKFESLLEEL